MNKKHFWSIIDTVNSQVPGTDYEGIVRVTQEVLGIYKPEEIARWGAIQREYKNIADTGGIYAAACMLNDYMSSDGFLDFRMWLISRGRDVYMAALKNPDTLAALELPEDIQKTMDTRFESYGYVANYAYEATGCKVDFYDEMMEIHPLSDDEKADLRADIEFFPHKISEQEAAKKVMPNLFAKYVKPGDDFQFTYRIDEDTGNDLLGDGKDSLKEIAVRMLEDAKKRIGGYSATLQVSGHLRLKLETLQQNISKELDNTIAAIRSDSLGWEMMTADNLEITAGNDGLIIVDDYINAYIGAWFDVDKRFRLETDGTDEYVNLYANYYPSDGRLDVFYIHHGSDGGEIATKPVSDLTDDERTVILQLMKDAGLDELVAEMQSDPSEDEGMKLL